MGFAETACFCISLINRQLNLRETENISDGLRWSWLSRFWIRSGLPVSITETKSTASSLLRQNNKRSLEVWQPEPDDAAFERQNVIDTYDTIINWCRLSCGLNNTRSPDCMVSVNIQRSSTNSGQEYLREFAHALYKWWNPLPSSCSIRNAPMPGKTTLQVRSLGSTRSRETPTRRGMSLL